MPEAPTVLLHDSSKGTLHAQNQGNCLSAVESKVWVEVQEFVRQLLQSSWGGVGGFYICPSVVAIKLGGWEAFISVCQLL